MNSNKVDKTSDPRYIFNPSTRRYVLKRNAIGRRIQERMSRGEYCEHIKKHATDQMLKQRDLIKSDLSDERLADILRKLVDLRIDEQLAQRRLMPEKSPPLKRQNAKRPKTKPKRRFVVKPPPEPITTDMGETTAVDTEYVSDSEISD